MEPGDYENDATSWTANNLIIIGNGGFAHLKSNGTCAEGKAIWVIKGTNTTVENIRFSGAKVPDNNGAGIRQEGANLTVRSCYFEDNQNGILTSDNSNSEILIEYSEFSSNGYGDGYTHNLYINHVKKLTFQYNYSHHTKIGHNLKTRAFNNYILYNRIMDEKEGTASYQIDIPNGGLSFVVGNVIEQGINAENNSIISYGREGITNGNNNFFLINNTIVNDKGSGYFVNLDSTTVLKSVNNIFYGVGEVYAGIATNNISQATNIATQNAIFADKDNYDYKLVTGASPINGGSDAGYYDTFNLNPQYIYYHKSNKANRVVKDVIDMGAFEF
ncbi:MAG: hypothetical protein A2Z98_05685 [Spirochaetes bacterium GWB1_27_13]|nr:MAG: hypothetical protein A2Z98_05685 [Spirochaetes bacterium GWB1_27_13]